MRGGRLVVTLWGRRWSRDELGYLAPGQERRYRLEIGALDGRDAIEAFAAGARELAAAPA
jgi:hypothetical protein